MPPYTLPEHKTRMTIKSKTHMGDGYNELRFEDMKGNEQIYIHGQRDQDIIIENDSREWVKGNEHLLVEKNLVEEIKGTSSTQASKDRMEGTGGERTVTVGGDEAHQVGGSWHQKVNGNVFLEGMTNGVIEMHKEITLKAPGGFIRIDGSGISIEGKVVNINTGGSAGAGFPVQAIPARSAERADSREAGSGRKSQAALTGQSEVVRSDTAEQPTAFGNSSFAESPVPGVNLDSSADALPKSLAPACALVLPVMRNAPIEVERLKISDEPVAGEWRKTVLDARQETSVSGKMETVNSFVCKNAACTPSPATTPQGPAALLQSGQGSSLDHAVIKYHTLQEAGVPADSMRIVSTDRDSLLLVRDGQRTLVSGPDFAPAIRDSATLASDVKPVYGFNGNGFFIYTPV
jgi:hypothetical protein